MVLERKFICNEVFWTANEFEDDFCADDFLDKFNVVFQTHVHAFSTTTLTGFVFCMMRFIFGSCQRFLSTVLMFFFSVPFWIKFSVQDIRSRVQKILR